jgi:hypothetical protein
VTGSVGENVKFAAPDGSVDDTVIERDDEALNPVSAIARNVTVYVPPRV